jgi:hypothetical protein
MCARVLHQETEALFTQLPTGIRLGCRSTVMVNYLEASIAADLSALNSMAEAEKAVFAWLKMLFTCIYVLRDVGGCMYDSRRSLSHHPVSGVRSQV